MCNPRNAYQRYNAAINTTDRILHTYMGMLLPNIGNITFSGAGLLNPISNDPEFHVIGSRGAHYSSVGRRGWSSATGPSIHLLQDLER